MISLNNITKLYGSVIGVNDLDLELLPGAYGLLGPNGSGKTTLINLITGQLKPTMGQVTVFGKNPWNNDDVLRRVGLCPTVDAFHTTLTAAQWVQFLVEMQGFGVAESKDRAEHALELVDMTHAMNRKIAGYSRGMKQRTKLAQAIAHEPELLILDEPFNGLDPIGRHDMSTLIKDWVDNGKSVLMASHVLHEVEAISPSFLLICSGRLLASGDSGEIHGLLTDVPAEIEFRCNDCQALASQLCAAEAAEAIKFIGNDTLRFSTRNPAVVYQLLPQIIQNSGVRVSEVRSAADSLQDLFTSLMRIHRGEH